MVAQRELATPIFSGATIAARIIVISIPPNHFEVDNSRTSFHKPLVGNFFAQFGAIKCPDVANVRNLADEFFTALVGKLNTDLTFAEHFFDSIEHIVFLSGAPSRGRTGTPLAVSEGF